MNPHTFTNYYKITTLYGDEEYAYFKSDSSGWWLWFKSIDDKERWVPFNDLSTVDELIEITEEEMFLEAL